MTSVEKIEKALLALIGVTLVLAIAIAAWDEEFFFNVFAGEDRVVEYGTAIMLFLCSLVLASHALSLARKGRRLQAGLTVLYALLFFFASGEEISWGQRIFGWQPSEFFAENNHQNETNLHNLVVGDVKLAKTLFGSVLTTVLLLYLIVLPLTYGRWGWVTRLADVMAVPVPRLRHAAAAAICTAYVVLMTVERRWEVYEFTFSLTAMAIFLMPRNRDEVT